MSEDLVHGGALDRMRAQFPGAPEPWLDLSTGINPWPYPAGPLEDAAFHHLPMQAAMEACRAAMADAFGAPAEAVLPAPGSELLIRLLPTIISPDRVVILQPTYGDHARVWTQADCHVSLEPNPLDRVDDADAVVLCHPNNPDGRFWQPDGLDEIRNRLAARGGWLIIDEAYTDLIPDMSMAPLGGRPGLIVLRSFGKFFGLAGLRLAALIAPSDLRAAMAERLGVWSVSGPALALGARAYRDRTWQAETRQRLSDERQALDAVLQQGGLAVTGGTDLFRFVTVDDATAIWRHLAHQGIYVRRFPWSPHHLRIGLPPTPQDRTRLKDALGAR